MRTLSVLLALLAAPLLTLFLHNASADPNTQPFNVGQYSYTAASVTTTPGVVLARNVNRAAIVAQNNGAAAVVIKFGSNPANATDGIVLAAGAIWNPSIPFVDAIYAESASGTNKLVLIEGIK
jgi:hypothetical protein